MHCQGGGGRSPGSLSLDALFHWKADDRECERGSKQIAQQARFVLCFFKGGLLKKKKIWLKIKSPEDTYDVSE